MVERARLSTDAVRQILLKRAAKAGLRGTLAEPFSPHDLRAGFITTAYRNGVPGEMGSSVRLEEMLAIAAAGLWHTSEIADVIGMSERTLRTNCQALLGMDVVRYLRLRRRERVCGAYAFQPNDR